MQAQCTVAHAVGDRWIYNGIWEGNRCIRIILIRKRNGRILDRSVVYDAHAKGEIRRYHVVSDITMFAQRHGRSHWHGGSFELKQLSCLKTFGASQRTILPFELQVRHN